MSTHPQMQRRVDDALAALHDATAVLDDAKTLLPGGETEWSTKDGTVQRLGSSTAWHEAAHAVVAHRLGLIVRRVVIHPDDSQVPLSGYASKVIAKRTPLAAQEPLLERFSGGSTEYHPDSFADLHDRKNYDAFRHAAIAALAGPIVTRLIAGSPYIEQEQDVICARAYLVEASDMAYNEAALDTEAARNTGMVEIKDLYTGWDKEQEAWNRAFDMIKEHADEINALALLLDERRELGESDLANFFASYEAPDAFK